MIKLLNYRISSAALRRAGARVTKDFIESPENSEEFKKNIEEMKKILASDGVGLAATQVNWPVQLFMLCIDSSGNNIDPKIFINPEILSYSKDEEKSEEGCLSFSNLFMKIRRPKSIKWSYQSVSGGKIIEESSGFYARAVQHEIDHCNGRLFIDRASSAQKIKIKKWLRESEV